MPGCNTSLTRELAFFAVFLCVSRKNQKDISKPRYIHHKPSNPSFTNNQGEWMFSILYSDDDPGLLDIGKLFS